MQNNSTEKKEKCTRTLGFSSLRVTPTMYDQIIQSAEEDVRTLQLQVKFLLQQGLEYRKLLKENACQQKKRPLEKKSFSF